MSSKPKTTKKSKVAKFVQTLYNLINEDSNNALIAWSDDGTSFEIKNVKAFTTSILPKYYRHAVYSSFVRQLNLYNFNKLPIKRQIVYYHQYFKKEHPKLLNIVKKSSSEQSVVSEIKGSTVSEKKLVQPVADEEYVASRDERDYRLKNRKLQSENQQLKTERETMRHELMNLKSQYQAILAQSQNALVVLEQLETKIDRDGINFMSNNQRQSEKGVQMHRDETKRSEMNATEYEAYDRYRMNEDEDALLRKLGQHDPFACLPSQCENGDLISETQFIK